MNLSYSQVALRAGHRCEYCHAPKVVFNFPFEVEHILPLSRGGTDTKNNLALACRSCNHHKAIRFGCVDPESHAVVRIFNPGYNRWGEHFQADPASGAIKGLTAIGRATIARLEMNNEPQKLARRQWVRFDLYP